VSFATGASGIGVQMEELSPPRWSPQGLPPWGQFVCYSRVVRMAGRWLAALSAWPRAACPETRPPPSALLPFACPHLPISLLFLPRFLLLLFSPAFFPSSSSLSTPHPPLLQITLPPYLPFHLLVCFCPHCPHKLAIC